MDDSNIYKYLDGFVAKFRDEKIGGIPRTTRIAMNLFPYDTEPHRKSNTETEQDDFFTRQTREA
jgi:hypothetical protein